MYYVVKQLEISGSHRLNLPYESKCTNWHGHNWIIHIHCRSKELNDCGMIVDFALLKSIIMDKLDHQCINDVLPEMNPTAENIAKWICDQVTSVCEKGECYRVDIQESSGNIASYVTDGGISNEDIRNI